MRLQPYLIFPGTCRQALDFYAEALGGTVERLRTVAESHLPAPPEHAERVFDSAFSAGKLRFRASDGLPGQDPAIGQNFSMFVACPDTETQARVFAALKEGGSVLFPLEEGFGMVEDRYAIRWMLALGAS